MQIRNPAKDLAAREKVKVKNKFHADLTCTRRS